MNTYSQNPEPVYLWPAQVPGETESKHEPVQTPNKERDVIRLTDVTNPAFLVFKPSKETNNGAGVIICPGGGYEILAINLEGYEVADWLTKQGFTAFVLQYRVPKKKEGALMDAQRAIRIIRNSAANYGLKPDQLGIMGFSAGGSLSARTATLFSKKTYTPVDKADSLSCRPDFALLIYPAYLDMGTNRALTPELIVDKKTPPMFLFATADDTYSNSALVMATALRDSKVPVELHLLAKGGHGYGLRSGNIAGETWPKLAEIWLKNIISDK
ncbi:MAG: alpha/beta hydrolase [Mariniphaga sp.]|nr:alpha/beta hydrolase [Mariniphaga sp.]